MPTKRTFKRLLIGLMIISLWWTGFPRIQPTMHVAQATTKSAYLKQCFPATATTQSTTSLANPQWSTSLADLAGKTKNVRTTPTATNTKSVANLDAKKSYVVKSIAKPTTVTVPFGTAFAEIVLPTQTQVVVSNKGKTTPVNFGVQWETAKGELAYNATKTGSYNINGNLWGIPANVNQGAIKPTITVNVLGATITKTLENTDQVVAYNTPFEGLSLPKFVSVQITSLDVAKFVSLEVQWDKATYKSDQIGQQVIKGTFTSLPQGVVRAQTAVADVTANVTVKDNILDQFIKVYKEIYQIEPEQSVVSVWLNTPYSIDKIERYLRIVERLQHYINDLEIAETLFQGTLTLAQIDDQLANSVERRVLVQQEVEDILKHANHGTAVTDAVIEGWINQAITEKTSIVELRNRLQIRNAVWLLQNKEATETEYDEWLAKIKETKDEQLNVLSFVLGVKRAIITSVFSTLYNRPITYAELDYWNGNTANEYYAIYDKMTNAKQYLTFRETSTFRSRAISNIFLQYMSRSATLTEQAAWVDTKKTIAEIETEIKKQCGWGDYIAQTFQEKGLQITETERTLDKFTVNIRRIVRDQLRHTPDKIDFYTNFFVKSDYSYAQIEAAIAYRNAIYFKNNEEPTATEMEVIVASNKMTIELLAQFLDAQQMTIIDAFQANFGKWPTSEEVKAWSSFPQTQPLELFWAMYGTPEAKKLRNEPYYRSKAIDNMFMNYYGPQNTQEDIKVVEGLKKTFMDNPTMWPIAKIEEYMREQIWYPQMRDQYMKLLGRAPTTKEKTHSKYKAKVYLLLWQFNLNVFGDGATVVKAQKEIEDVLDGWVQKNWSLTEISLRLAVQRVYNTQSNREPTGAELAQWLSKKNSQEIIQETEKLTKDAYGAKRFYIVNTYNTLFGQYPTYQKLNELDAMFPDSIVTAQENSVYKNLYRSEAYRIVRERAGLREKSLLNIYEYHKLSPQIEQHIAYYNDKKMTVEQIEADASKKLVSALAPMNREQFIDALKKEFKSKRPFELSDIAYFDEQQFSVLDIQLWAYITLLYRDIKAMWPSREQVRGWFDSDKDPSEITRALYVEVAYRVMHNQEITPEIREQFLATGKDPEQLLNDIMGTDRANLAFGFKQWFNYWPTKGQVDEYKKLDLEGVSFHNALFLSGEYKSRREHPDLRIRAINQAYMHWVNREANEEELQYTGKLVDLDTQLKNSPERDVWINKWLDLTEIRKAEDAGIKACDEGGRCFTPYQYLKERTTWSEYSVGMLGASLNAWQNAYKEEQERKNSGFFASGLWKWLATVIVIGLTVASFFGVVPPIIPGIVGKAFGVGQPECFAFAAGFIGSINVLSSVVGAATCGIAVAKKGFPIGEDLPNRPLMLYANFWFELFKQYVVKDAATLKYRFTDEWSFSLNLGDVIFFDQENKLKLGRVGTCANFQKKSYNTSVCGSYNFQEQQLGYQFNLGVGYDKSTFSSKWTFSYQREGKAEIYNVCNNGNVRGVGLCVGKNQQGLLNVDLNYTIKQSDVSGIKVGVSWDKEGFGFGVSENGTALGQCKRVGITQHKQKIITNIIMKNYPDEFEHLEKMGVEEIEKMGVEEIEKIANSKYKKLSTDEKRNLNNSADKIVEDECYFSLFYKEYSNALGVSNVDKENPSEEEKQKIVKRLKEIVPPPYYTQPIVNVKCIKNPLAGGVQCELAL
jgi:hypothetical protein